jgi:hypothetical protein
MNERLEFRTVLVANRCHASPDSVLAIGPVHPPSRGTANAEEDISWFRAFARVRRELNW